MTDVSLILTGNKYIMSDVLCLMSILYKQSAEI
jgi:hypothetical protein